MRAIPSALGFAHGAFAGAGAAAGAGVACGVAALWVAAVCDHAAPDAQREIAPAKIVGTYGSEIVRHAVMFKPTEPPAGVLSRDFLRHVSEAASTYAYTRRQHPVTFAAFRQSPWYHHGVLALEKSQLTVHSPFLDNDFVRTVYQAPISSSPEEDVRIRLIMDGSPALARVRSDRGVGGNGGRVTLNEAWELVQRIEGKSLAAKYGPPRAGDVRDSQADTTAAIAELGHSPQFTFEQGMRLTLDWYRANK